MATIFKHNNKLIQCMNLQKKLKKLHITNEDIEVIWEGDVTQDELEKKYVSMTSITKEDTDIDNIIYHHFFNKVTKEKVTCVDDYVEQTIMRLDKNEWIQVD